MNDRYQNLKNGINLLNTHPHIWVTDYSYIYQSEPMYYIKQNDYYNMVIKIETNLTPINLLDEIKIIETKVGRKKQIENNMPRILDIDILTFGNLQIHSNLLEIPHSKISERKFVLKPWNDIAPNFLVPSYSTKVSDLLERSNDFSHIKMLLISDEEGLM